MRWLAAWLAEVSTYPPSDLSWSSGAGTWAGLLETPMVSFSGLGAAGLGVGGLGSGFGSGCGSGFGSGLGSVWEGVVIEVPPDKFLLNCDEQYKKKNSDE